MYAKKHLFSIYLQEREKNVNKPECLTFFLKLNRGITGSWTSLLLAYLLVQYVKYDERGFLICSGCTD